MLWVSLLKVQDSIWLVHPRKSLYLRAELQHFCGHEMMNWRFRRGCCLWRSGANTWWNTLGTELRTMCCCRSPISRTRGKWRRRLSLRQQRIGEAYLFLYRGSRYSPQAGLVCFEERGAWWIGMSYFGLRTKHWSRCRNKKKLFSKEKQRAAAPTSSAHVYPQRPAERGQGFLVSEYYKPSKNPNVQKSKMKTLIFDL